MKKYSLKRVLLNEEIEVAVDNKKYLIKGELEKGIEDAVKTGNIDIVKPNSEYKFSYEMIDKDGKTKTRKITTKQNPAIGFIPHTIGLFAERLKDIDLGGAPIAGISELPVPDKLKVFLNQLQYLPSGALMQAIQITNKICKTPDGALDLYKAMYSGDIKNALPDSEAKMGVFRSSYPSPELNMT
jgi:hypothetical protein